jgi:hypothetical protein
VIVADFLYYALHYIILRTLYDGARSLGVPSIVLLAVAVSLLFLLYRRRRA